MHKRADTLHPIHDLLAERWSPRAFQEREVEGEKLGSLFEAARWAPSSFNEQPWRFLVGRRSDDSTFERLAECLVEGNAWARSAPVLLLSVARTSFSRNAKPNRHALHDAGLASAFLVLQAQALGIVTHMMAGYDAGKARELFAIPEDHEPVAMMALGYAGDPESLPDPWKQAELAPRSRHPLREIVFGAKWGEPFPL